VTINSSNLSAISRLFSSAVFREMAAKGRSALFARLIKESSLLGRISDDKLVSDVFDLAFSVLRAGSYRDEYVYKAAITHKVLLGKHSLRTASMLTEFRVGSCKADIAILNGTATVYEIKSERDSLSRLQRQISEYRKVFPSIYVIAGENHIDGVVNCTSDDVGILQLSKRHQITELRRAVDLPNRVCPTTILESIRTAEAKEILRALAVEVPMVPNTKMHGVLREIFATLPPTDVHTAMVRILKKSRNLLPLGELVSDLPQSLQPAALSISIKRAEHQRLLSALNLPLTHALAWA